jgi:hypothetical protein
LKRRLRQRGYPQMGWDTGTPHGREGYTYDFSPRPNHPRDRAATSENAADLPPDYISDLGLSGAFYDQEVLGLFTAFEGLAYTLNAAEGGSVADPPEGKTFSRFIGGVDWGYTNPTAAAIFGIDQDERAHYNNGTPHSHCKTSPAFPYQGATPSACANVDLCWKRAGGTATIYTALQDVREQNSSAYFTARQVTVQ